MSKTPIPERESDSPLDFDSLLPSAPFREVHARSIDAPIDDVWQAFLEVRGSEIRLLQPLFLLRALPARLSSKRGPITSDADDQTALASFQNEGFVTLRQDPGPIDGCATFIFGAAGRFWSPAHNPPIRFTSGQQFIDFDAPGNAKTVARFTAISDGPTRTRLETETVVDVTDPASKKKFAVYWAIIRGPSGLLRRSWLAAVDRRATQ